MIASQKPMKSRRWTLPSILAVGFVAVIGAVLIGGSVLEGPGYSKYEAADVDFSDASFDVTAVGSRVVFSGRGTGGRDLFLWDAATNSIKRLTDSPETELYPSFDNGGTRVLFVTEADDQYRLCSIDIATRRQESLYGPTDGALAWPVGIGGHGKAAFAMKNRELPSRFQGDIWKVYKLPKDGSDPVALSDTRITNLNYLSSRDGTKIFASGTDATSESARNQALELDVRSGIPSSPVPVARECWYLLNTSMQRYSVCVVDLNGDYNYYPCVLDRTTGALRPLVTLAPGKRIAARCPRFAAGTKEVWYLDFTVPNGSYPKLMKVPFSGGAPVEVLISDAFGAPGSQ